MTTLGPPPLLLHVAWHPQFAEGRELAKAIYSWFRGDPHQLDEVGLGIPIRYRTTAPGTNYGVSGAISTKVAAEHVVIALIDANMVADKAWRHFLIRTLKSRRAVLFPVAADDSAFSLGGDVGGLNFLRIDDQIPPGETPDRRARRRRSRLLSILTQAMARLLDPKNRSLSVDQGGKVNQEGRAPAKIKLFISHAKADGRELAKTLRHEILQRGQLEAFFDETDLAWSYEFETKLNEAVEEQSAAFLAILTDAYADRPWCRKELRLARKPVIVDTHNKATIIRQTPTLIVDALAGRTTRYMSEIGTAKVKRWKPEAAGEIVDTLLAEVVRSAHATLMAQHFAAEYGGAQRCYFCDQPDVGILKKLESEMGGPGNLSQIVFPGGGLPADTLNDLTSWWESPPITAHRFEDVELSGLS